MSGSIPVSGQAFADFGDWVARASRVLTAHPLYFNAEHDGPAKGWRGAHFTALCYDQLGRRCRSGADFMRARDEGAFPVWWVWPDQVPALLGVPAVKQEACPDCGVSMRVRAPYGCASCLSDRAG